MKTDPLVSAALMPVRGTGTGMIRAFDMDGAELWHYDLPFHPHNGLNTHKG